VRDLLSDELEPVRLELDPLGGLLLNGLTRIQCGSIHEVLACLDTGSAAHPPQTWAMLVSIVSAVLRIRVVYPGYEFFPSSIRTKEWKYFNLKNCFYALRNMILVVHLGSGSRIRILIFYPSQIQGSNRLRIPDSDAQHCVSH
jgi:hypothetical protein